MKAERQLARVASAKFWINKIFLYLFLLRLEEDAREKRVRLRGRGSGRVKPYASSSIGRVAVSKTVGWGFESLLACS